MNRKQLQPEDMQIVPPLSMLVNSLILHLYYIIEQGNIICRAAFLEIKVLPLNVNQWNWSIFGVFFSHFSVSALLIQWSWDYFKFQLFGSTAAVLPYIFTTAPPTAPCESFYKTLVRANQKLKFDNKGGLSDSAWDGSNSVVYGSFRWPKPEKRGI